MSEEIKTPKLQRIIRQDELPDFVGIKRTAIAEQIKAEKFPKPVKLLDSGYAVGWLEQDIINWQQGRIAKHREQEERRKTKKRA